MVVLICISLMMSDVECLIMCLLAIFVVFGEMSVCVFLFLIGLFVFGVLSLISSLHILNNNPLSDMSSANIFSHSVGCLLVLLIISFAVHELFILMYS